MAKDFPSRELLVALNNGKLPRASTPDIKKIQLEWNLKSNSKQTKHSSSRKQSIYGKLFGLITQIVYPYWSYNIKNKACGTLIIEACDCKPLSSIINIKNGKLLKKPNEMNIAFLDYIKLPIFLQNLHQNDTNKKSIIDSTLNE